MNKILAVSVVAIGFTACSHKPADTPKEVIAPKPPSVAMKAQATLKAAKGSKAAGTVMFVEEGGKTTVTVTGTGIKKGLHGFHVHAVGDCSDAAAGFKKAGDHFNPTQTPHADVNTHPRHVGDMGNIEADKKNKVNATMVVEGLPLGGPESIIGKAVIIHKDKDDLTTQPSGKSGDRIACGVIEQVPNAEPTPGPVEAPK